MNSRNDRIWEIIAAYLCGEIINDADNEELQKWLGSEESCRLLKKLESYYKEQQVREAINVDKNKQYLNCNCKQVNYL